MSLLDDLKKEAEQKKVESEQIQSSTQRRQQVVEEILYPKMEELYRYFKDLKEQLEVVKPDLEMNYEVKGYGTLSALKQGNYRIFTDNPDKIEKFTFGIAYVREGHHEFRQPTANLVAQQKEYLWKNNLKFKTRDASDGSSTFLLELYVPVSFEFEADTEACQVNLRVRNLKQLGMTTIKLSTEKLDKEFMEELAKAVLHKENRFDELTGNTIDESTRMRIRQQLEAEKKKKDAELARQEAAAAKKAPEKKDSQSVWTRPLFGKK